MVRAALRKSKGMRMRCPWGEAGMMEPEVGDLGPGHEGRRGLLGLRRGRNRASR